MTISTCIFYVWIVAPIWARGHQVSGIRLSANSANGVAASVADAKQALRSPFDGASRHAVKILMTLTFALIAVAGLVPIDIIVSGIGTTVGDRMPAPLTAPFAGVVEEVMQTPLQVVDGEAPLVRLSPSGPNSVLKTIDERIALAQDRADKVQNLLGVLRALSVGGTTSLSIDPEISAIQLQFVALQDRVSAARDAASAAEKAQRLAEANLKLAEDRGSTLHSLIDRGVMAKNAAIDIDLQINNTRLLAETAASTTKQAISTLRQAESQLRITLAQASTQYESEFRTLRDRLSELNASRDNATQFEKLSVIYAPFRGYLEANSAMFKGKTVAAGETLFYVTPSSASYRITLVVNNKDIAHVVVGNRVRVRITPLMKSRFAQYEGEVVRISDEPIAVPQGMQMLPAEARRPPEYKVEVELKALPPITAFQLRGGMEAKCQIIVGRRVALGYVGQSIFNKLGPVFSEP